MTEQEANAPGARRCIYDIRDRIKGLEDFQEANYKDFQQHKAETKEGIKELKSSIHTLAISIATHDAAERATKGTLWKAALIIGGCTTFGLGLLQLAIALYKGSGAP